MGRFFIPLLLLACLPLCALHAEEEPTYDGKTITEWIEALEDKDVAVRKSAAEALSRIGPDAKAAVPSLIQALKDKEWFVHEAAAKALKKIRGEEGKTKD